MSIALKLKNNQRIGTKEQLIKEGLDPKFFENKEKWTNELKLMYNVDDISKIKAEHIDSQKHLHINQKCFRSLYQN